MNHLEDLPPQWGGYPRPGGTGADVTEDGDSVWKLNFLKGDGGVYGQWRGRSFTLLFCQFFQVDTAHG